ncbi:MAG: shikimate kinase [Bacteroidota bacterium]|jgi:shikimate kinase|nr:shikimate kinase [Bacteroidota bacterium]HHU96772.1 shikimate kinase [Petrimonas sp.]
MERIFIVGYMGSGKTTVGRQLARSLSLQFVDLDLFVEGKYRKTVLQLFVERGEEGFRELERQALCEVAEFENVVISTGGGTPCFFNNMALMNRAGITVYLQAEPEELAHRLISSRTSRPLIAGKSKEELVSFITEHLVRRERYYLSAAIVYRAGHRLRGKDVQVIVSQIEEKLRDGRKRDDA